MNASFGPQYAVEGLAAAPKKILQAMRLGSSTGMTGKSPGRGARIIDPAAVLRIYCKHHDASRIRIACRSAPRISRRHAFLDRKTVARPARCTGCGAGAGDHATLSTAGDAGPGLGRARYRH